MLRRLFRKDDRDKELRQLTRSIKRTMQTQKREVKGIADIAFTVGKKEASAFKAKNEGCRARGEPYYVRVKQDIGSKEKMVSIWTRTSPDKDEFITDLVLASTQPNHEHFFFGDKESYRLICHSDMRGLKASDPTLCLWFKKGAGPRFVADIRVSYTKDDQIDLARKNFEMLPFQCLSQFGLAYANLWVLWSSVQIVRLADADHVEKELADYTKMLARNPEDKILGRLADQAKWRLREAQLSEEDHAKDIPSDDLTYTKEFLALRKTELDKMRSTFDKCIDSDHDGKVSVEDFCLFLREPVSMSPFIRQIFALSAPINGKLGKSASNTAPSMDGGATLKATAVFCMLSSTDLLKLVFAWYDSKGYGVIDNDQFLDLLEMFHPRHRDDVVARALKEVDLPADGKMKWAQFESDCRKFPHILYPAFRVQEKMRQRFFGPRWWRRKLARYAQAKELLEEEQQKRKELDDLERRQRYEIAEELKNESLDLFDIKKRRKKKSRKYQRKR